MASLLGGAAAPAAAPAAADPTAKVTEMAQKLGIDVPAEVLALGTADAMTNKLVEIAVGQGKSEDDIVKAMS